MDKLVPTLAVLLGLSVVGWSATLENEIYNKQALEAAIGDFSQSLYIHLAKTSSKDNFVFSPLSLHSALSLLYLGTKDDSETQKQLGSAMGIVNSHHLLKMTYQRVIETYQDQKSFLYGNHI